MDDFAAQVRGLLAGRDRARRGQLFRPDRGIAADARFVAAVEQLAEDHAEAERERIRVEVRRLQDALTAQREVTTGLSRERDALRAELAEARAAKPATERAARPRTPRAATGTGQGKPTGRGTAPGAAE